MMIYADHAATTSLREEALHAMLPYMREVYGNASSLHEAGQKAKKALEDSRRKMASLIGASPAEIFFTSGGTESDNWAIFGSAEALKGTKNHLVTSQIEHPAVLNCFRKLGKQGWKVTYLPVNSQGVIDMKAAEEIITEDTALVSVMAANNEIGTIEPIKELSQLAHARGALIHCDAVQAFGKIPIQVNDWGVDMMSISAHKFYGPKGTGMLYIRKGTKISPWMLGGSQERRSRAGTENVPGIVGMVKAAEMICADLEKESSRVDLLTESLTDKVLQIPGSHLNSTAERRVPGLVNVRFDGIEGESLLVLLDMAGICVSTASACEAGSVEPSHVLSAIGLGKEAARNAIRISLGRENTEEDVSAIAEAIQNSIEKLRRYTTART